MLSWAAERLAGCLDIVLWCWGGRDGMERLQHRFVVFWAIASVLLVQNSRRVKRVEVGSSLPFGNQQPQRLLRRLRLANLRYPYKAAECCGCDDAGEVGREVKCSEARASIRADFTARGYSTPGVLLWLRQSCTLATAASYITARAVHAHSIPWRSRRQNVVVVIASVTTTRCLVRSD